MQVRVFALCVLACTFAASLLLLSGEFNAEKVPDAGMPDSMPQDKAARNSEEPFRRNIRNVTPPGMLQAPLIDAETIVRLPAKPSREPAQRPPEPVLYKLPTILAAGVLRSGKSTVRVAGVDPLHEGAVCTPPNGRPWPCGAFAKTAFQRLVRQRTVACAPNGANRAGNETRTNCKVGSTDLAEWLVESGWAVPAEPDGYQDAMARAKAGRLGQWGDPPQLR